MKGTDSLVVAFTWSPRPALQRNDPKKGHENMLPLLRRLTSCCSQIHLTPEFHVNGTLHYHGQLVISDQIKWYKSVLPSFKSNGFVVIKKNPNTKWMEYMMKDFDVMKDILGLTEPLDMLKLKTSKRSVPPPERVTQADLESYIGEIIEDYKS